MGQAKIDIPTSQIIELCRQYHVRELALFGSVLRDDFGPESDVDILIELEPEAHLGYQGFFRLQDELTTLLGREVDLFTPHSLKPFARDTAARSKTVVYAA
jgi:hypothetical protein